MKKLLLLLAATFFFTGCSIQSDLMSENPTEATAQEGEATITFYRLNSTAGGFIQAPVVKQVNKTDIENVGVFSSNYKLTQVVTPGEHVYVVGGEGSSGIKCTVAANKHYYVRITPRFGILKARFAFEPLTKEVLAKDTFIRQVTNAKLMQVNAEGKKWFVDNYSSMKEKLDETVEANDFVYLTEENGLDAPL